MNKKELTLLQHEVIKTFLKNQRKTMHEDMSKGFNVSISIIRRIEKQIIEEEKRNPCTKIRAGHKPI